MCGISGTRIMRNLKFPSTSEVTQLALTKSLRNYSFEKQLSGGKTAKTLSTTKSNTALYRVSLVAKAIVYTLMRRHRYRYMCHWVIQDFLQLTEKVEVFSVFFFALIC